MLGRPWLGRVLDGGVPACRAGESPAKPPATRSGTSLDRAAEVIAITSAILEEDAGKLAPQPQHSKSSGMITNVVARAHDSDQKLEEDYGLDKKAVLGRTSSY